MLNPSTIAAVCGWAIPPSWFKKLIQNQFPDANVRIIYPKNPFDAKEAKNLLSNHPADLILGYSLGSLWLLHHRRFLVFYKVKALLAPIFGFSKESGLGGKIPEAQLKYMIKWLSRNAEDKSILQKFYKISDLEIPEILFEEFPDSSVLIRGLEFLNTIQEDPSGASDYITLIGKDDSFLEAEKIKCQLPNAQIVCYTGHAPQPLLAVLSQLLKK